MAKTHVKFIEGLSTVVGDIAPTSFTISNNQASPANITNLVFANAVTRAAEIFYSIEIDADENLFEAGTLVIIQKDSFWDISQGSMTGDDSAIGFSITTDGQIQYVSPNYAGFVSGKIKFRAITTLVG